MSNCFIIMPFGKYFDSYYQEVIKPIVSNCGLVPKRADEVYSTNAIIEDIYKHISNSEICIADVTKRNPNVSYELGMAHSLGKPVIMITQNIDDVPFDYNHRRIIEYDPMNTNWKNIFESSLEATINEVIKDPKAYVPFKFLTTRSSQMKDHIKNIFYSVECFLEKKDVIDVDEKGNAKVSTTWTIDPISKIYHLCENRIIESPGKIEMTKAYDKLNGRNMEVIEIERSPIHLSCFMLFQNFKEPKQKVIFETEMILENYLESLATKGRTSRVHQAAAKSGIKYKEITEIYNLPKLPRYKNSYAEYISHPDKSKIGKKVYAEPTSNSYSITINYKTKGHFEQDMGAEISDGSPNRENKI